MSVARTARRRRSQYAMGFRGLKQVFGTKGAPLYPGIISKEKSAKKGEAQRAARARGAKI